MRPLPELFTRRSSRRLLRGIPSLLALAATACGGATPQGSFPTRDALSELAASGRPQQVFAQGSVDVDSFELVGPLPDAVDGSTTDAQGPWQKLLAGVVASRPGLVVASRAMECAARQTAAFVAAKNALPAQPLVRFIAARCGVPTGALAIAYRSGEAGDSTTDDALFQQWSPEVNKDLGDALGPGQRAAGIGFARAGKRAAVAVVTASRQVHLERVPLVPEEGKVVLEGELLGAGQSIRAMVTRGRFGFETCIRDIERALPRFRVECAVSQDDPSARVELASFEAGRELGDTVIDLRVHPAGELPGAYARAAAEGAEAAAGQVDAALLARINEVRKEAGLGEVRLADAQSRTAARLAPHYFAALNGHVAVKLADVVALGLLAGWDIVGAVREGHFTSMWLGTRAPASLVNAVLDSPFGRETLLDPSASMLAVGAVSDDAALGAILSTYSLFEPVKSDVAPAVVDRLSKLRGKIKRPAPQAVPELGAVIADTVARVEAGLSTNDGLERVLGKSAEAVRGSRVHAWVVTTSSVDKLEYPSDLLSKASLRLAVGVARYKPEGSPWTRLAVFFVTVEDPPANNTALAPLQPAL